MSKFERSHYLALSSANANTGKGDGGGELTEKEIIRAERNSGVISNRVREIQVSIILPSYICYRCRGPRGTNSVPVRVDVSCSFFLGKLSLKD